MSPGLSSDAVARAFNQALSAVESCKRSRARRSNTAARRPRHAPCSRRAASNDENCARRSACERRSRAARHQTAVALASAAWYLQPESIAAARRNVRCRHPRASASSRATARLRAVSACRSAQARAQAASAVAASWRRKRASEASIPRAQPLRLAKDSALPFHRAKATASSPSARRRQAAATTGANDLREALSAALALLSPSASERLRWSS